MQELLKPNQYTLEIKKAIYAQSSLGVALANRWYLGWPKRVKDLIQSNQYHEAFLKQAELEREVLSEMGPEWNHLADHEKLGLMEINPAPPME